MNDYHLLDNFKRFKNGYIMCHWGGGRFIVLDKLSIIGIRVMLPNLEYVTGIEFLGVK